MKWFVGLSIAFLVTALVGVWAAYDQGAAWSRFESITVAVTAMVAAAYAVRGRDQSLLLPTSLLCGLFAAMVGCYYLLSYDWTANQLAKITALQQAGEWVQAHRPLTIHVDRIDANASGNALAICAPFSIAALAWATERRRWPLAITCALLAAAALAPLVLTTARGAWLGLAAGAVAAGYLFWEARRLGRRGATVGSGSYRNSLLLVALALLLLVSFSAAVAFPGFAGLISRLLPAGGSTAGRIDLWRQMLSLLGDYPFTGSGLGSTMMVFSTYVMLLHVGFISHAHNLFLQTAIEQGLPGMAALIGLLGMAIYRLLNTPPSRPGLPFRAALLASLIALVVHGMVDALPYVTTWVVPMFLPVGLAVGATAGKAASFGSDSHDRDLSRRHRRSAALSWSVPTALLLGGAALSTSRAALEANLGAVAQTRIELSVYRWPKWPIQDEVRQARQADLAPALDRYEAALSLDPENATANRRLGQIELSLGDYEAASRHLQKALAVAPGDRATRQMLGESHAIAKELDPAAALWRTIDVSQGQLALREWWYDHIGAQEQAAWVRDAATLVEPTPRP